MSGINRPVVLGAVLGLAATVLAGCGEEPAPPRAAVLPGVGIVTTGPDGVQEITVQTQDEYTFVPDGFTVAPGPVRLTVVNVAAGLTHNLRFPPDTGPADIDAEIPLLPPGQEETIEFTVEQPGRYPFECSFHDQLGHVGTMTVNG